MASPQFSLFDLKAQASRLEEFLRAGGVPIKHTNALEAVARMHGAKDWQTLAASATVEPSGHHETTGRYVVVSLYGDVTKTSISTDRGLALLDFFQTSRMIVGVFGESAQRVEVLGQDLDDGLPLLSLVIDDTVYCALQQPSSPSTDQMVGTRLVPGSVAQLTGIDSATGFFEIAEAVSAAFNTVDLNNKRSTQQRLGRSMAARMMSIDFNEVVHALAAETKTARDPAPIGTDPRLLMKEIDAIKLMHEFVATVR